MRGSNPKAEGRRKPEARRSKAETRRSKPEGRSPNRPRPWVSVFGFRNSAFFRASGFGLRSQVAPRSGTPLIVRTIRRRYVLQKMSKLQAARLPGSITHRVKWFGCCSARNKGPKIKIAFFAIRR